MVIPERKMLSLGANRPQRFAHGIAAVKSRVPLRWLFVTAVALLCFTGCGKSNSGAGQAAKAPKWSGQVWEIDGSAGRSAMPAAVLAYANGLDVIVLDGNDAYGGMTKLEAKSAPDGARTFQLPGGLVAKLLSSSGGKLELRFSTGDSIPMRKREAR